MASPTIEVPTAVPRLRRPTRAASPVTAIVIPRNQLHRGSRRSKTIPIIPINRGIVAIISAACAPEVFWVPRLNKTGNPAKLASAYTSNKLTSFMLFGGRRRQIISRGAANRPAPTARIKPTERPSSWRPAIRVLAGTSANRTTAKQAATKTKVDRDALKLYMTRRSVIAAFAVPADIAFLRQMLAKWYQVKEIYLLRYCRKLQAVCKILFTKGLPILSVCERCLQRSGRRDRADQRRVGAQPNGVLRSDEIYPSREAASGLRPKRRQDAQPRYQSRAQLRRLALTFRAGRLR